MSTAYENALAEALLTDTDRPLVDGVRTYVIGPYFSGRHRKITASHSFAEGDEPHDRSVIARLDEAVGLARAIEIEVIKSFTVNLDAVRPATYLGTGRVDEIAESIQDDEIGLVIMDCALSPVQQRNLERAWRVKVIDRTGLILEIFGRRAHTREGALQVELAHLAYQKSRLVRSWTHLERQRGGFGFLGGPGETQIESDRRIIQERMTRIERDLDTVRRTRTLHRASRKRVPYPVVSLVGYTNAGKSTLFNRLTSASVMAQDMLFATLDPTARAVTLPHGGKAILSDTVGFISDLPTMLVAAFRATLEDVIESDVLLHIRDVSHGDTEAQAADVEKILRELEINPADNQRIIEVWNKADQLSDDERVRLANVAARRTTTAQPVLISAQTGEGIETLLATIEARIAQGRRVYLVTLNAADGVNLNWLYEETEVLERRDQDDGQMAIMIRIAAEKEPRLLNRCPKARRVR